MRGNTFAMDPEQHERWWRERGDRELRELLLERWDPIGISQLADAPLDEYEHYAGGLVRRLRAGAGEEEIAAVLEGFRADMGLEPSDEPPLGVAREVCDWYRAATGSPGT
jgi:hypothetical protein